VARHWVKSAVRISSASAAAGEITTALGVEPTSTGALGDLMSPRNPKSQRFDRHVWLLDSDVPEESSLEDHLRWAVELGEHIRERASALPEDWSGDVVIGWTPNESQEGVYLDRDLLAALARTSFNIALTAYAIGDE
jgi:Domain of unknown function (DUF4279)